MNLNLQTPINPLGYGVAGLNIAKALLRAGTDLHIHPIGQPDTALMDKGTIQALELNVSQHAPNWPLVKIWHQHALLERIGNGKYYGFPIFELDTFSEQEKYNLLVPDSLIVCSEWAKKVVQDNFPGKILDISVVPLGVDRSIFYDQAIEKKVKTDNTYRFFTIGKLEYRKGHDFIVECFSKAFDLNDNVELNMMINNPFLQREISQQWYNSFKKSKLGPKINILNPVPTHRDVADFINSQDCGLFAARAEGWNLELLESMSCGKPVIATNYSAHTEFCNQGNSYLIDIEDKEIAHDKMGGMWFRGQGSWAELDYDQEEQMIRHMRYCYENRPNNLQGIDTAEQFTWDNSAKKLLEIL